MGPTIAHFAARVGIVARMAYSLLVGVVYALSIARITRLINADTILDRPRLVIAGAARAAKLAGDDTGHQRWSTLMYFVQCPWCVGMWLAIGTAWIPLWFNTNVVARYLGIALAISHLVGVFAFAADTEEVDYEDETVD